MKNRSRDLQAVRKDIIKGREECPFFTPPYCGNYLPFCS